MQKLITNGRWFGVIKLKRILGTAANFTMTWHDKELEFAIFEKFVGKKSYAEFKAGAQEDIFIVEGTPFITATGFVRIMVSRIATRPYFSRNYFAVP